MRRRWVQETPTGFIIRDRAGEREYRDDEVLSMALLTRKNHQAGLLKSITNQLVVWIPSEGPQPTRVELRYTYDAQTSDPLQDHRISRTASIGRASRVPLSVTTNGRSIRIGCSAMASSSCSSVASARFSSA